MTLLPRPTYRQPFLLFLEDDASVLTAPDGAPLGALPVEEASGPERRAQRVAFLRSLIPPRGLVQICVGHSRLGIECQEAPQLPAKEARVVAQRLAGGLQAAETLLVGHCLEPDTGSRGGHVLWAAFTPAAEMNDWADAMDGAGLELVNATAWPRALLRGLPVGPDQPRERVILAVGPGQGRLLILRSHALVLLRTFRIPMEGEEEERLALAVEETARTLQFYKQRYRGSAPAHLLLVGATALPAELETRLRSLGLATQCQPEALVDLLHRGLQAERGSGGLDLRPEHVQEAQRVKVLRAVLVLATVGILAAFTTGGALLRTRERLLEAQATKAEAALVQAQAADLARQRAMAARLPLLRLRAAEHRQAEAIARLSRLSAVLLSPPPELRLEKVEVQQASTPGLAWSFQVSGTAVTGASFSVGPLARYLGQLQQVEGLELDPLREVSVSDRMEPGASQPDARAVTRFALSGRFK